MVPELASSVGSSYFPEIRIRHMGRRHPIRLSIVSGETASHQAAPGGTRSGRSHEALFQRNKKSRAAGGEDHGVSEWSWKKMEMKFRRPQLGEKQCVCPEGGAG